MFSFVIPFKCGENLVKVEVTEQAFKSEGTFTFEGRHFSLNYLDKYKSEMQGIIKMTLAFTSKNSSEFDASDLQLFQKSLVLKKILPQDTEAYALMDFLDNKVQKLLRVTQQRDPKHQDEKKRILESIANSNAEVKSVENFNSDSEFMSKAVSLNGFAFLYASEELKDDPEVAFNAICSVESMVKEIGPKLKASKDFMIKVMARNGNCLRYLKEWQKDRGVVLKAIEQNQLAFSFAHPDLFGDKTFVMVVLDLKWEDTFMKVSPFLQDDKDVALKAVGHYGWMLKFASKRLQDDKDVVMKAVMTEGGAWDYASPDLQKDEDVIVQALIQNPMVAMILSKEVRGTKSIMQRAMAGNKNVYYCAPWKIQEDPEIKKWAIEQGLDVKQDKL